VLEVPPCYGKATLKCRTGYMEVALDRVVLGLEREGYFMNRPCPSTLVLVASAV